MEIRAVAFDVDGTLYPSRPLYVKSIPLALAHWKLFKNFHKVRRRLREENFQGDIHTRQAEYLGEFLGLPYREARRRIEEFVYRRWTALLRRVSPFEKLQETLLSLKDEGYQLALLSDFPLSNKLSLLGLEGWWDVAFSSEEVGSLKPSARPFEKLARELGLAPEEILYVGDHYEYDVLGARGAGMRSAHLTTKQISDSGADFSFSRYGEFVSKFSEFSARVARG